MKQPAQSLQAMFEEQLSKLPRVIATNLVREKLKPFGKSDNDSLITQIVDSLLRGEANGTIIFDDGAAEDVVHQNISLDFNDDDLSQIDKIIASFRTELPDLICGLTDKAASEMLRRYKREWKRWRPFAVAEMDQFHTNLEARWGKGFELLRMLIELSRDAGVSFHKRAKRSRSSRRVHLNTALVHLHSRAIQIASEIMTLMERGFADGAMARWRTLHEVTCVAIVLRDGGDEIAERYLAHEAVEAKKALAQYQRCHSALGYAPFPARKAKQIQLQYESALAKYGKEFGSDYGWAANKLSISRPNFSDIEAAAGRAMMRSHYKLASQNVHAGVKGIVHRLGALDQPFAAIAGATNVGFVEPGQNLGRSLLQFTILLVPTRHTLDAVALIMALISLEKQIGPALAGSERRIAQDERRIRKEDAERRRRRQSSRSS